MDTTEAVILYILCYISIFLKNIRYCNKTYINFLKRKQRAESPINSGIALLSPRKYVNFSLAGLFHFLKIGETKIRSMYEYGI
jgi:hypothetical protein